MKSSLRRIGQLSLVLALALVLGITAALPTHAAPAAQDDTEVSLGDIEANATEYAEQSVQVSGEIGNLGVSPNVATLSSTDRFGLDRLGVVGEESLFQDLQADDTVIISGTVRMFDSALQEELGFELSEETAAAFEGRPVLVAQEITQAGEMAAGEGVVARIGERDITQEEFNQRFENLVRTVAARQGIPLNEETRQLFESLRTQYLEQYAREEALLTEAEERGITVSDEELTNLTDQVREQFPDDEAFQQALTEAGFADEAEFHEFMRRSEILQRIGQEIAGGVEVTDEEVQQFYEENQELFTRDGEVVPLEDVESNIRTRLQQQEFQTRITELEETADVQTFPENLGSIDEFEIVEE